MNSFATYDLKYRSFIDKAYNDITDILAYYKPIIFINEPYKRLSIRDKTAIAGGEYHYPSNILIYPMDIQTIAIDNMKYTGVSDIKTSVRAEITHTLINLISRASQKIKPYDDYYKIEVINERHVWDDLYPLVAPMLKKKYKIDIYNQTIDVTRGYEYPDTYEEFDSCDMIIDVLYAIINKLESGGYAKHISEVLYAYPNIEISIKDNRNRDLVSERLKVMGIKNIPAGDNIRNYLPWFSSINDIYNNLSIDHIEENEKEGDLKLHIISQAVFNYGMFN